MSAAQGTEDTSDPTVLVPADLEVEDRVVGPVTFRLAGWLAATGAGAAVVALSWPHPLPIGAGLLVLMVGIAGGFGRVGARPLAWWIRPLVSYVRRSHGGEPPSRARRRPAPRLPAPDSPAPQLRPMAAPEAPTQTRPPRPSSQPWPAAQAPPATSAVGTSPTVTRGPDPAQASQPSQPSQPSPTFTKTGLALTLAAAVGSVTALLVPAALSARTPPAPARVDQPGTPTPAPTRAPSPSPSPSTDPYVVVIPYGNDPFDLNDPDGAGGLGGDIDPFDPADPDLACAFGDDSLNPWPDPFDLGDSCG